MPSFLGGRPKAASISARATEQRVLEAFDKANRRTDISGTPAGRKARRKAASLFGEDIAPTEVLAGSGADRRGQAQRALESVLGAGR